MTGQSIFDQMAMMNSPVQQFPPMSGMQFANPMQKAMYILQAMRKPAQFVKQHIPDLPEQIQNDPNQILQYLQQTRGVTNQQIQQAQQMGAQIQGIGSVK